MGAYENLGRLRDRLYDTWVNNTKQKISCQIEIVKGQHPNTARLLYSYSDSWEVSSSSQQDNLLFSFALDAIRITIGTDNNWNFVRNDNLKQAYLEAKAINFGEDARVRLSLLE